MRRPAAVNLPGPATLSRRHPDSGTGTQLSLHPYPGVAPMAPSRWLAGVAGGRPIAAAPPAGTLAVSVALHLCRAIAPLAAAIDALLRPTRTVRAWRAFRQATGHPWRALADTWFSRAAREVLRALMAAGLARALLARVTVAGNVGALDRGAVLATCHSPWGRLIAAWIARDGRVAMLATRRWTMRAPGAHEPADLVGMRRAIGRLRAGRCVAVTIDHFTTAPGCDTTLLHRPVRACLGAARIAVRGGGPLVPVTVRHHAGRIIVTLGDDIPVTRSTVGRATEAAIAALDRDLARDPSIWADALRFVSRPPVGQPD